MMMKTMLLFSGLLFSLLATAQKDSTKKLNVKFTSINSIGLLEGEAGSAFHLQTINGVQYKTIFAGVGVGFDYYVLRTIPLFIDLRKYFCNKPQTPFIYADAGMHFAWPGKADNAQAKTHPGLYYDAGVGYRVPVKSNAIIFTAGYAFKKYTQDETFTTWCLTPPCPESESHYELSLRRIAIKAGFSF